MGLLIQKFGNRYDWQETDDGSDPITLEDLLYIARSWEIDMRHLALDRAQTEYERDVADANAYEDGCPHSGRFGISTWQLDFCSVFACNVFEECVAKFRKDNLCPADKGKFARDVYKLSDCDFCRIFHSCMDEYEQRRRHVNIQNRRQ